VGVADASMVQRNINAPVENEKVAIPFGPKSHGHFRKK